MSYINYESERDRASLDLNTYPRGYATVFPRNIYGGEVVPYPNNIFSTPRDSSTLYIVPVERTVHPPYSSRFGKGDCPNGYCSGHRPGKYNDSMMCDWEEQPKDVAPLRFYRDLHTDVYTNFSDARVTYNVTQNNYVLS
ncbi:MAG TPA: hypothetical protein VLE02_01945 [Nitrosarchaeum sp.]|nr:hypothetical protein [Nitrosarchaeum sp.]